MHIAPPLRTFIGFSPTGDLGPYTIYRSRKQGVVWFTKAPPTTAPTTGQLRQRDKFRLLGDAWQNLEETQKHGWNLASRRLNLFLCGYTLWCYWQLTRDLPTIRTIERQSKLQLV